MNFDASYAPRTQDLPTIYSETNGVFVFTREMFERTNRRVGLNPYMCEIGFPETADINYPEDFVIVNAIYTEMKKNLSG